MRGGVKTGLLTHVKSLKQLSRKSQGHGEAYNPNDDPSHEAAMKRAYEQEKELRELRRNSPAEVKAKKKSSSPKPQKKEKSFSEQQRENEMEYYLNNP